MRLRTCLLLLLMFNQGVLALAQDTTAPVFFEKAYLHTDRDAYGQGEDIWFKAYVVNGQTNAPINYSHTLYVELIGPAAKVVTRKVLRLENGLGNGDFKLADTLTTGNYRLRAYTNWMRNFGDNFIFEKSIRIVNDVPASTDAATSATVKKNKKPIIPNPAAVTDTPTVSFFPEGGAMVNGLSSVIAVKAQDSHGRGMPASGKVLNTVGEAVASFSCDSLGFGAFTLFPDAGQQYQAQVNIGQQERRFGLPKVAATGFNLHVQVKQPAVIIAISCDEANFTKLTGQQVYITIKHKDKTCIRKALGLSTADLQVNLPDELLPDGISSITLSDENNQPLCERLFYVNHPSHTQLLVGTDKPVYQPKQQVTVSLKLNMPGVAHLSLAAVDAATVPVQPENIVSYINLQSEIRGNIEQPNRYFDTTNTNRFKQLDLLLLTQGWRDFVWKRIADTTLKFEHEVEAGITMTGFVKNKAGSKGLPNMHVSLHAPQAEGTKFFEANTDSTGRFAIYGPVFYGYQYMDFSSRNFSDKAKGKSNSGGLIMVDSLYQNMLPVNPVNNAVDDTLPSTHQLLTKLNIPQKQQLKEVKIVASNSDFISKTHKITQADYDYGTVRQYLLNTIKGAHMTVVVTKKDGTFIYLQSQEGFDIDTNPVYADGSKLDRSLTIGNNVLDMPMGQVIRITVKKIINPFGFIITTAEVALRPGAMEIKDYFDNTMADMVGYYKAREFYQPKPEELDSNIDTRVNTIHWEPNITTNENGEATVSYLNLAQKTGMRLVVQGVSESGKPLAATAMYEVK